MKPKKLTLREMHKLYLLLRHSLPEKEEVYLIDEIEKMAGRINNGATLVRSIEMMYPGKSFNQNNPLELLLLFIRGLKQNEFFDYVAFINGIRHGGRKS